MHNTSIRIFGLLAGICGVFSCAWGASQSVNVAMIGSGSVINGGFLPTSGPDLAGVTFTNVTPANVGNVAAFPLTYDTAVLNVASAEMACNTGNLPAASRTALIAFVASGHKVIIWDSECTATGGMDYSWLPFPFTTNTPGAAGANGTLTIVEENTLSSNNSLSPYYINAALVGSGTDAVGDANVMTTLDPNWCVDMRATNVNGITGPVHTYAKTGNDVGLVIYSGLDVDDMVETPGTTADQYLRKIFVLEILQPFNPSNLPCGTTVVPRAPALVGYAVNLNVGDSVINLTNAGTQNTSNGALTNLCANVYAFSPDEQMISCCSCTVTPNALVSLSARSDLISNTLTPAVPNSIVVKFVATAGASCSASNLPIANLASGLKAWGTTIHALPSGGGYQDTELPLSAVNLSDVERARLAALCGFIQANGSGYGICKSCRLGALGAVQK
jgi:hypothetical protein